MSGCQTAGNLTYDAKELLRLIEISGIKGLLSQSRMTIDDAMV
jgi:hypothetical protein